jgi:hypothetical protein
MQTGDTEKGSKACTRTQDPPPSPNPKRVVAGRLNRQKRQGLTPAGRERLRQAALRNEPWQHTRGPITAAGKARSAQNGKLRQKGPISVREARATLAGLRELLQEMRQAQGLASAGR